MTDLTERLRELTDDHAILLPIAYIDGPDYAELTGASGEKVALTVYPALLTAVNAIPDLLTTLETLTQENARLREVMKQAFDAPMIDHSDSGRSVYGILRKALGGGDDSLA